MGAPHVPAPDATLVDDATRNASRHRPGLPVDDTLLTLDQARVALLGDVAAERSNAWPSIKTLRRAYTSGQIAVVQLVAGGRVMVWRSELMRWASAPRAAPKQSLETSARGCTPPRQPVRRQPPCLLYTSPSPRD